MTSEREALERLKKLDLDLEKTLSQEDSDGKVKFDNSIAFAEKRVDRSWYWVKLRVKALACKLDDIEKVVYLLHPTFNPNKIVSYDYKSGFEIGFQSYGAFHAMALVIYKDKTTSKLIQFLPIGTTDKN